MAWLGPCMPSFSRFANLLRKVWGATAERRPEVMLAPVDLQAPVDFSYQGSRLRLEDQEACRELSMTICEGVLSSFVPAAGCHLSQTEPAMPMQTLGEMLSQIPGPVTSIVRQTDAELMRQMYLRMVEEEDPDAILRELALPLRQEFALQGGNSEPLTIAMEEEVMTLDKDAISVGRLGRCDVWIPEVHSQVSRIQCWIFNLEAGILVVDGWSFLGTALVARSTCNEVHESSSPNDRHVLMIPRGEAVSLRLGDAVELTLNPKLCMVCAERPRSVRLACGHQAFCVACIRQLEQVGDGRFCCPLCRQVPSGYYEPRYAGIHTLVPPPIGTKAIG
mmetsp:Transcript_57162/g.101412  ORF Transcript_57162/g.101412 Transcript_57162/m.101412 type:complete len:334 (+) Transcript_57162:3-1004(+)